MEQALQIKIYKNEIHQFAILAGLVFESQMNNAIIELKPMLL